MIRHLFAAEEEHVLAHVIRFGEAPCEVTELEVLLAMKVAAALAVVVDAVARRLALAASTVTRKPSLSGFVVCRDTRLNRDSTCGSYLGSSLNHFAGKDREWSS